MFLKMRKHRIEVRNKKEEYVGCLPDDISKRLIFFLEAKSKYDCIVKSATKNSVEIFIREKYKGAKVRNFISFPDNIQEDLSVIIGKTTSNTDPGSPETGNECDEELDETESVEDLEELAKKAEEDGFQQVAKLFRAAAEAETVHALNHLKVAGGIKTTAENLKEAIAGDTQEFTEMYPKMIKEAENLPKKIKREKSLLN